VSGNGDDGLDGITVTSAVAVCCVTAPGTDAVGLSAAARKGGVRYVCMTTQGPGCRVCYQDCQIFLCLLRHDCMWTVYLQTDALVIIVDPEMTASRAVLFASSHMIFIEVPKHFRHQSRNSFYVRPWGAHWDAGNAAHAGQSIAGFCDSHVGICQRELRGRAGQHSSTSAFACATQCSGHSLLSACC